MGPASELLGAEVAIAELVVLESDKDDDEVLDVVVAGVVSITVVLVVVKTDEDEYDMLETVMTGVLSNTVESVVEVEETESNGGESDLPDDGGRKGVTVVGSPVVCVKVPDTVDADVDETSSMSVEDELVDVEVLVL
jgi:hypothetical protein